MKLYDPDTKTKVTKYSLEKRIDSYEDFYRRAFRNIDVQKIYEEGGAIDYSNFKSATKNNIINQDYWKAMFDWGKRKPDALGKEIYKRFYEKDEITKNKAEKFIVKKGKTFEFNGKTYKGGMFVPKTYFARRTNQ